MMTTPSIIEDLAEVLERHGVGNVLLVAELPSGEWVTLRNLQDVWKTIGYLEFIKAGILSEQNMQEGDNLH
jgi:uncharacterized protein (DUF362 family)